MVGPAPPPAQWEPDRTVDRWAPPPAPDSESQLEPFRRAKAAVLAHRAEWLRTWEADHVPCPNPDPSLPGTVWLRGQPEHQVSQSHAPTGDLHWVAAAELEEGELVWSNGEALHRLLWDGVQCDWEALPALRVRVVAESAPSREVAASRLRVLSRDGAWDLVEGALDLATVEGEETWIGLVDDDGSQGERVSFTPRDGDTVELKRPLPTDPPHFCSPEGLLREADSYTVLVLNLGLCETMYGPDAGQWPGHRP